ncbi:hypothetical protein, partial [Pseudomonas aeruginosa]|uniref:hypothetical protein n=1 Tax=Pseudomonas aeruginosa TaxID=287 RepID=UPI0031B71655
QHKDRQQYWNALPLEKAGAAKIIEQSQLSVDAVANTLAGWSRETLLTMAERARAASIPDATERVANEVSRAARAERLITSVCWRTCRGPPPNPIV